MVYKKKRGRAKMDLVYIHVGVTPMQLDWLKSRNPDRLKKQNVNYLIRKLITREIARVYAQNFKKKEQCNADDVRPREGIHEEFSE